MFLLECQKSRDFRAARWAPASPKIQDHHLTFEIRKLHRLPVDVIQLPVWSRYPRVGRPGYGTAQKEGSAGKKQKYYFQIALGVSNHGRRHYACCVSVLRHHRLPASCFALSSAGGDLLLSSSRATTAGSLVGN